MANKNFKSYSLPNKEEKYMTEFEVRELIAATLASYQGAVRFRTIESVTTVITDFTDSQHNHSNAAGGGQFNPNNAFTTPVTVPNGGTGANSLTGIVKGNGAGAMTAVVPLAGTGTFYAAASSGGAVNVKFDYDSGVITART